MNMIVLRRSRQFPLEGDIFVYRLKKRPYGFGRVIRLHTKIGGFTDATLVYIYNAFSARKTSIPMLRKSSLLIEPTAVNRRPWTMGYFETIQWRPLLAEDVLPTHCFRDDSFIKARYVDEFGKILPRRVNPCGLFALDSFQTIDARISIALCIDPSPNTMPK